MHVATGQKQGRGSAVVGEANSSEEIQALSKEVLDLFYFIFFIVFETAASQNPLAFSFFDICRLLSCTLEFRWSIWQGDEQVFYTDGSD